MQNTTTPLIDQLKTPEPTDSKKLSESLNGRWLDNYFNLKGFKLYQLKELFSAFRYFIFQAFRSSY